MVQLNEVVPNFELTATDGTPFSLQSRLGQYVLLYFYPKDMTPGCTQQACDFRDFSAEFATLNCDIIGISADDLTSHHKFQKKYDLPFLLLADIDHAVSTQFDVWKLKNMYGKQFYGIERASFLISPTGVLVHEWRKVKVNGHIQDVLTVLKQHAQLT